jgi:hypothetical protein
MSHHTQCMCVARMCTARDGRKRRCQRPSHTACCKGSSSILRPNFIKPAKSFLVERLMHSTWVPHGSDAASSCITVCASSARCTLITAASHMHVSILYTGYRGLAAPLKGDPRSCMHVRIFYTVARASPHEVRPGAPLAASIQSSPTRYHIILQSQADHPVLQGAQQRLGPHSGCRLWPHSRFTPRRRCMHEARTARAASGHTAVSHLGAACMAHASRKGSATSVPSTSMMPSAGAVLTMKAPSLMCSASPPTTVRAEMMLLMHTMLPAVPPTDCSASSAVIDTSMARAATCTRRGVHT